MIYWNPNPIAFTIPIINLPIYLYGICFVLGFILGYYLIQKMMRERFVNFSSQETQTLVDQLTWFVIGGAIIGARLGHVFFYDWDHYRLHPWQIFNTREGGLASHGGAVGILIALFLFYYLFFRKKTGRPFLELLDMLVVPTALAAPCIRIGNFFNQEIIGTPTNLPWAITFGSPIDHPAVLPRHPAQLYEAFCYLLIFGLLWRLWQTPKARTKPGLLSGLFFSLVFGSRFFIEFVKAEQTSIFNQSFLQAGQLLSIPFVLAGLFLIWRALKKPDYLSHPNS